MNKEELIGKLQMVYARDINALNELIGYYDGLKQGIEELQQENKELKEDINKYKRLGYKHLQEQNNKLEERIEKAIEYIENDLQSFLYSIEYKKLLELLKGDKQ